MTSLYMPIIDGERNRVDDMVSHFCLEMESSFHELYQQYKDQLKLEAPEHGFLADDCYTPAGNDECNDIILSSARGIAGIIHKLKSSKIKSPLASMAIPTGDNLSELTRQLVKTQKDLYEKFRTLDPSTSEIEIHDRLSQGYGSYEQRLENAVISITNLLHYFAKKFPEKKHEYYGFLALIFVQLRQAKVDFYFDGIMPEPGIEISYRDEGRGKAPFYDHYTIQRTTGIETEVGVARPISVKDLKTEVKSFPGTLAYGTEYSGKKLPIVNWSGGHEKGLLVIPGQARATETKRKKAYKERKEQEEQLIKEAMLTGRPILAICAGSWRLWQNAASGGELTAASGHNNRSGMPRIISNGSIGYNMQIHRVSINSQTLLAEAMGFVNTMNTDPRDFSVPVNSVHWQAVSGAHDLFSISATASKDDKIAPSLHKTGQRLEVAEGSAEAFESKHGAPVFGIQWHPEAYNPSEAEAHQQNLIKYMAQAGKAYARKRQMLREFDYKISSLINKMGLLSSASTIQESTSQTLSASSQASSSSSRRR